MMLAEFTVTAEVPVELNVTDCVAVVLITTLPKEILVAFTPSFPVPAGESCKANVAETPPAVAVIVAVCDELTAPAAAVNPTVAVPAGTVTLPGTATAASLLARLTVMPLVGAAAVKLTVHGSDPAPLIEAVLQETALSAAGAATPAALMLTTMLP
jgi:hypothetical protein